MEELQGCSDGCWNWHLEENVGTWREAKGRAWPGKPCNERQKGDSLVERRSKGNLSTCKRSRGTFLPRWHWSCAAWGLSSFLGAPKKSCSWGQGTICGQEGI